ncbi:MAG: hypothetical protein IPK72_18570 [Candidatus Eisenbacteria bacterium]|nr:hypothetical protein [Candidatus Eisenbacteria bacterium]
MQNLQQSTSRPVGRRLPILGSLTLLAALVVAGCQRDAAPLAPTGDATGTETAAQWFAITGPTVITVSGHYRVTRDFEVDAGDGIVVRADNVALSLGYHTLTGPGNKEGRGIVLENASNVALSNGTLASFGAGLVLIDSDNALIRGITVEGGDEVADPPNGIPPQIGAMLVNSDHNRLVGNTFNLVNLGIFVRGGASTRNSIRLNNVQGGDHGLLGICYNPVPGQGDVGPHGDDVRQNTLRRFGTGIQTSVGSVGNTFTRNVIDYFNSPWEDLNGTNHFVMNETMQVQP